MKINKIANNLNIYSKQNKKLNNISKAQTLKAHEDRYIEPKYYHAQNNISFKGKEEAVVYMPKYAKDGTIEKLYISAQYTNNRSKIIEIDNKDYKNLFADKDGNPDGMVVLKFASMFKNKMIEEIIRLQKNIEFFENLAGDYPDIDDEFDNTDDFDAPDEFTQDDEDDEEFAQMMEDEEMQKILLEELSKKQPNDAFVRNVVSKIPDEDLKQELASEILGLFKQENEENLAQHAKDFCIDYLYLSQTKAGFDYSNGKDKKFIIEKINDIEDDFDTNGMLKDFLQISKRELGEINIPFIKTLVQLAKNYDTMPMPLDEIGNTLAKYQAKDKENAQKIADLMVAFTEKYSIDDLNFETLFNFAFNPITQKYDTIAAETLLKILNETDEWIDEEMIDFDKHYAHFKDAQDDIIINYFDLAKDRITGKIGEFAPSTIDFLENQKERYAFRED